MSISKWSCFRDLNLHTHRRQIYSYGYSVLRSLDRALEDKSEAVIGYPFAMGVS